MYGSNLSSAKRQGKVEKEDTSAAPIETYFEDLFEKRSTAREYGLKGLTACLREEYHSAQDFCESNASGLTEAIQKIISKGNNTQEQILACQLTNLFSICLPNQTFSTYMSLFEPIIKDFHLHPDLVDMQCDAVRTLALTAFLFNHESTTTFTVMKLFESIFISPPLNFKVQPRLSEAAIRAWGLLASSLTLDELQSVVMVENFPDLVNGLTEYEDVDCKAALGEVLIMLIEAYQIFVESEEEDYDPYQLQEYIDMRDFVQTLETLSHYSKSLSKKEKQKQKNIFKDLLAVVKGYPVDSEVLTFRGSNLTFTNATDLFRLNYFRTVLADGFQPHMQENPLLALIFNFSVPSTFVRKFTSKLEKKLNNRLRNRTKQKQRVAQE